MFTNNDKAILRDLSINLKNSCETEDQEKKRDIWRKHTSLKYNKPLIFVHPDGSWDELLPRESLKCEDSFAKELEYILRQRLIRHQYIQDDVPLELELPIRKVIHNSMWGIEPKRVYSNTRNGAWHHVPIIEDEADWKKLKMPILDLDEKASELCFSMAQDAIGDVLPLRQIGETNFSFHMMHWYCDFRGLENMMFDLIELPDTVHEVIRFFTDGVKSMLSQYEKYNLISLNNDYTFHYTGGIGYTNDLPRESFDPNHILLKDVWGAAEAQEFSSISPQMHEEFILQYEREILEPFGLNGYGCCDDLGKKLDGVLKIKNLRRVAVCPWADIADFVPKLKKDYIMTWKPQPSYLATDEVDEDTIYQELSTGIKKAKGGILELVLRDTHTCQNKPERFTKWIEIARKAISENWEE